MGVRQSESRRAEIRSLVQTYGGRVQIARERVGLSQAELADAMGWSDGQGEVSKLEKRPAVPDGTEVSTLVRLAQILLVPLDWLVYGPVLLPALTAEELEAGHGNDGVAGGKSSSPPGRRRG